MCEVIFTCYIYLFIVCTGKLIVKSLRSWSLFKPDSYDYWINSNTLYELMCYTVINPLRMLSHATQSLQKGISGKRPIITTADIDYTVWTTGSVSVCSDCDHGCWISLLEKFGLVHSTSVISSSIVLIFITETHCVWAYHGERPWQRSSRKTADWPAVGDHL